MSNNNKSHEIIRTSEINDQELDELMITELDDRLEFSAVLVISNANLACNSSGCTQNGSCGKKGAA